jgi:putative multiple sugar transport system substrate-binding protein
MLSGKKPEINGHHRDQHGAEFMALGKRRASVDASNWKEVLIGSGYYKESQIK